MKSFVLALIMTLVAFPVFAAGQKGDDNWLKPVETKFVCMVNNRVFNTPQIPIEVGGKTYYGCCPMCKEMLAKDDSKRSATDPVSNKPVDKATAVIGSDVHGMVYYFENEENLRTYASGPMPDMEHKHTGGMEHEGMKHAE
jgi:YHS domain-containing protein